MTKLIPQREPTVGQIVRLMRDIRPTFRFENVKSIDADFLSAHGFEGVIWDIDGTLMGYHAKEIDSEFREQLKQLFHEGPGKHCILSNCKEDRFLELGEIIPEAPIVRAYRTDQGVVRRYLHRGQDSLGPKGASALLAGGAKAIRKPSEVLIDAAMRCMGVENREKVLMVGDQFFTDIASAKLAGIKSAKVDNWRPVSFPRRLQRSQRLERILYRLRHGTPV